MTCRIEKQDKIENIESITRHTDSMDTEYYVIKYIGIEKMFSKYSRLDSIFELLKEMEK